MRDKLITIIKKNDYLFWVIKYIRLKCLMLFGKFISDETFLRMQYKQRTGKKLNLDPPVLYNEKMQYFKLHCHEDIYHTLSDKYEVRDWVEGKLGSAYLTKIYGIYESVEEIPFDQLPDRFVLKLTNGSGFNYICEQKNEKEIRKIKRRFHMWLKLDFYMLGREWIYKGIKNRIICEEYLDSGSKYGLIDYKVFCFDGVAKMIQVDYSRFTDHKRNLYTPEWEFIDETMAYQNDKSAELNKPVMLKEMINAAEKLSQGFQQVRVDFYAYADRLIFGEMTFSHGAGYLRFGSEEFEKEMGDWWNLCDHTSC
ncbi:glycosyl transferase [Clostridiales bacterium FE2010]|nr:glycosyl transferase [Clostridiales bacterium FE2010]